MKPGDKIIFQPEGIVAEVKSIEEHHQQIPVAKPGDNIGFNIRNVSKKRGSPT
jgi:elongation factor 1-alpha